MTEDLRYPLHWPAGWPRTPLQDRQWWSRYKVTEETAKRELLDSLRMLGAQDVILSTNVRLRVDGLPYTGAKAPDDAGVAVYFTRNKRAQVIACDKYTKLGLNYRAIGLAIEGMRAIERAGVSELLERAFMGFAALPAVTSPSSWRAEMGFAPDAKVGSVTVLERFRELVKIRHPDKGGSEEGFMRLCGARDEAMREIGAKAG